MPIAITATHLMLADIILDRIVSLVTTFKEVREMSEEQAKEEIVKWQGDKEVEMNRIRSH